MGARVHGYDLQHPYWSPRVLDTALATGAAAKGARGREKGHLRVAAETILPAVVAWRKKTPIHHGTGISVNLERRVEADTGSPHAKRAVYRSVLVELTAAAVGDPTRSVPGHELYDRAVFALNHDRNRRARHHKSNPEVTSR